MVTSGVTGITVVISYLLSSLNTQVPLTLDWPEPGLIPGPLGLEA